MTPRRSVTASPTTSRPTSRPTAERSSIAQGVPKTTTDYTAILTAAKAQEPRVDLLRRRHGHRRRPDPQGRHPGRPRRPVRRPRRHLRRLRRDEGLVPQPRRRRCQELVSRPLAAIGDFPGKAEFEARYEAEYGAAPTGYSATGYACAQVVIDALNRMAAARPTWPALRENLRAAAVDPSITYDTVLGDINVRRERRHEPEDHLVLRVRPAGADGAGDWVFEEQLDFAE